ncbi:hypothetical protein C2W62_01720 [Candidatus Entotheonella serta]|nr:hypothetical protein C2W62_01720 [Candidatus Entotheonella serta]
MWTRHTRRLTTGSMFRIKCRMQYEGEEANRMTSRWALVLVLLGTMAVINLGDRVVVAAGDPDVDPLLAPLGPVPVPPDNPITADKVELGKLLFFDPKLTGDASLSCASCHHPKQGRGYADPISRGYPGTIH